MENTKKFLYLYSIKEHDFIKQLSYNNIQERKQVMMDMFCYVDVLLETFEKGSIISDLNDFQTEMLHILTTNFEKSVFADKSTIPLYFVNIMLQKYNMVIEEC